MKKIYITIVLILLLASYNAHATIFEQSKKTLEKRYNINLGLDVSLTSIATKKTTLIKELYSPYLYKDLFETKKHKGTLNFSMNFVNFSPTTPSNLAPKLGVANLFDSYDTNYNELYELYYLHTIKSKNKIELGLGQIPVSKFDTITRSPLQEQAFQSNSLYQNGSFTYPTSGVGSYISLDNNYNFSISIGAIDATNPLAQGIHTKNLDKFDFASFLSLNYYPKIKNLYQASYSLLIYDKPNVAKAPTSSRGISISLLQDIASNKSIFFKYNTSNGNYSIIKNSYSVGFLYHTKENNTFAIGYSINKIKAPQTIHKNEELIETYYKYNLTPSISITPDVEIYKKPAYKSSTEILYSLNLKVGF